MKTTGRGSRTSSSKSNSPSRSTSPSSAKQASTPSSPEEAQVTRSFSVLSIREQGNSSGGKGVNFLKKNRKAVQTFYKRTGVPVTTDEVSNKEATQSRTRVGTPHLIGDDLGTPSNKGSSFFLTSSHHGVREPHKNVTAKKKQQHSNS